MYSRGSVKSSFCWRHGDHYKHEPIGTEVTIYLQRNHITVIVDVLFIAYALIPFASNQSFSIVRMICAFWIA